MEVRHDKKLLLINGSLNEHGCTDVALISFNDSRMELNLAGDLLAVLAAFVWACYSILTRKTSSFGYPVILITRRMTKESMQAGGGMMMLLLLTGLLGYELKTAVGTSVFIMAFTAFTGAVSHFAIGGMPDVWCLLSWEWTS